MKHHSGVVSVEGFFSDFLVPLSDHRKRKQDGIEIGHHAGLLFFLADPFFVPSLLAAHGEEDSQDGQEAEDNAELKDGSIVGIERELV